VYALERKEGRKEGRKGRQEVKEGRKEVSYKISNRQIFQHKFTSRA
jgi:hypothetical protein